MICAAPYNPAPYLIGGKQRSKDWPKVQCAFLRANPRCAACGATKLLNVHHKKPYHLFPELELDPSNLLTLCETPTHNCHFILGHCLNWSAYNVRVTELVVFYHHCLFNRLGEPYAYASLHESYEPENLD